MIKPWMFWALGGVVVAFVGYRYWRKYADQIRTARFLKKTGLDQPPSVGSSARVDRRIGLSASTQTALNGAIAQIIPTEPASGPTNDTSQPDYTTIRARPGSASELTGF